MPVTMIYFVNIVLLQMLSFIPPGQAAVSFPSPVLREKGSG